MFKLRRLRCSFCRKSESEVSKLVAGPGVFICDACVAVASRIMEGNPPNESSRPVKSSARRKLLDSVRELWQGDNILRVRVWS
ncbi:MAG: ClpX C4-type zinc finger protein [Pyrinomonadaceae bacterium]